MAEGFLNYSLLILLTSPKKGHSGDADLYYTNAEFKIHKGGGIICRKN